MTTHPDYHQSPFAVSVPSVKPPGLLARFAYGTLKALTVLAALSGVAFSLYRNDVLLDGATRLGVQASYLEVERQLLGAPGWGTPRTTPALSAGMFAAVPVPRGLTARTAVPQPALAPTEKRSVLAASGERDRTAGPRATADGVTIVAVEALPLLQSAPATQQLSAPVPTRKAERNVSVRVRADAPVARTKPADVKVASRPASAPPAAPPKAAAVVPPRAPGPAAPTNENPLKAAIRSAVQKETTAP